MCTWGQCGAGSPEESRNPKDTDAVLRSLYFSSMVMGERTSRAETDYTQVLFLKVTHIAEYK